ncbi:MAG: alpha/beta hydrolase [Candidatus Dormibacteraeota bacterium]|nr:alpha/beta hydrolase [Candidatus Dormibacteraeota bacterium]
MDRELTLDVNGPIEAVDHGGDGPPMLLVHGLGGSLVTWRDVTGDLARTHHVWSLDLIGFGHTPRAGRESTIPNNVGVVERVAEQIGGGRPVVLVGNSMGGLISVLVASRQRHSVASLVLVDAAMPMTPGGRFPLMLAAAFVVMRMPAIGPWVVRANSRRRGPEHLVDDVLKLCTVDVSRISAETREALIEEMRWRQEQEEPDRAFLEASSSLMQWLWHRDAVERHIRRVQAPTLLMHGDQDRLVMLSAAQEVAALRPDWTFRVLDNTGHIPMMERPRKFIELVDDWLGAAQPAVPASTSRR